MNIFSFYNSVGRRCILLKITSKEVTILSSTGNIYQLETHTFFTYFLDNKYSINKRTSKDSTSIEDLENLAKSIKVNSLKTFNIEVSKELNKVSEDEIILLLIS